MLCAPSGDAMVTPVRCGIQPPASGSNPPWLISMERPLKRSSNRVLRQLISQAIKPIPFDQQVLVVGAAEHPFLNFNRDASTERLSLGLISFSFTPTKPPYAPLVFVDQQVLTAIDLGDVLALVVQEVDALTTEDMLGHVVGQLRCQAGCRRQHTHRHTRSGFRALWKGRRPSLWSTRRGRLPPRAQG